MKKLMSVMAVMLLSSSIIFAQTTEFNYQGSLKNGGIAANGNYDFEFALFGAPTGGAQLGSTIIFTGLAVTNGVFSVQLNFGGQFPGANRFLEIRVRPTGGGLFTTLNPRQLVTSSPYSVKSLNAENATIATNATQLGGMAASQYVITTDPRLSNDRVPLPGSSNYIQNTKAQQSASNFNITGIGAADTFNAVRQYNIGGLRVLSIPGAGGNTFVGITAGESNSTGGGNSFFGGGAGFSNMGGENNSFFGANSGRLNTEGNNNAFFGIGAGRNFETGSSNTFVGSFAGFSVASGNSNTVIGANAGVSNNLTFATAVGAGASVNTNNTVVLGRGIDTVLIPGNLVVTPGIAGSSPVCFNAMSQIAACSSSLRYKTDVQSFTSGLNIIKHLRPVSFTWRDGGVKDVGFGAEDVAAVEPLFASYNKDGQVEGVKYDRLSVVLVNAVREQQTQIELQQKQIDEQREIIRRQQERLDKQHSETTKQRAEFDALKKLVCAQNPAAEICQPND